MTRAVEDDHYPCLGGKFTRLLKFENQSLVKNITFTFLLDNLQTRLALSDTRTSIKFRAGLEETNLVEILPQSSLIDPERVSFLFSNGNNPEINRLY